MQAEISSAKQNPLLDRFEVEVEIEHDGESTPSEEKVVSRIAAEENLDEENIEVEGIHTGFGSNTSRAELKIYEEFEHEKLDEEEQKDIATEVEGVDYEEIVSGTISSAKDQLNELDNPDYRAALKAEKQNKDRKTLKEWLEGKTE